ncbi:hypothetical protein BDN70DRAFT_997417 [Pholiota conissans]|uniref:Uncharacterized protein n=1 Tax=Pholiota conissans TaxID=109636 RepID=A0A9P5YR29_9AGAR|nr:hypothetical protein BDN70DRAFT_997417 [Pholiota conissans]
MASVLRRIRPDATYSSRRPDSLIESEGNLSRHSSIQGPYREGLTDTSFPVYCMVRSEFRGPRVYARSTLSSGNGVGIYHVEGSISRPKTHFSQGAVLGDVGYLTERGTFYYCFNIFHAPDDAIQPHSLPPRFSPIDTSLSTENVRRTQNHFSTGAILCSEGIRYTRKSDSPLKFEFVTSETEGAVLILPNGATREELVDPSMIHAYVKEHAVSWYQYLNGNSENTTESPIANGTLWVVTSVDRTDSWAMATFPSQDVGVRHKKEEIHFTYEAKNDEWPWKGDSQTCPLAYTAEHSSEGSVGAVLLGVLSVALSPSQWSRNVAYIPPHSVQSCPVVSVPTVGLQARLQRIIDFIKRNPKPPSLDDPEGNFHPSVILLHILLLSNPSAVVGVIDDSVWIPHLNKRLLTHPEVVSLVRRVFDNCDILNTDGLVTLVPKNPQNLPSANPSPRKDFISSYRILSKKRQEPKSIVHQNIAKVLWLPE